MFSWFSSSFLVWFSIYSGVREAFGFIYSKIFAFFMWFLFLYKMGLCAISSTAAHGGGTLPVPLGRLFLSRRTKGLCRYVNSLHSPIQHTSPAFDFLLVKYGKHLYNRNGAEILLCGRSALLHRGVGGWYTLRPALLYLPYIHSSSYFQRVQAISTRFDSGKTCIHPSLATGSY